MEAPKPAKKVILVSYHGHEWPVYPLKCRGKDIYRVFHRVNGERRPKTFSKLSKAKADARSVLKEVYSKGGKTIHLSEDDRLDWKAGTGVLKQANIRSSLETVCRHYADLLNTVGSASLLTELARKHADSRTRTLVPVLISELQKDYVAVLKKKDQSKRYIDAQRSHIGQFAKHIGNVMSDQVTREDLQKFIDTRKKVGARGKKNLLAAISAMMNYGKSQRCVPQEWEEDRHVDLPAVKPKKVETFTAEELLKLLAAAPDNFEPILALQAFAGIRSSEVEGLRWEHIRLLEPAPKDQIIRLDLDVTEASSKRSIQITEPLKSWLNGPFKAKGNLWSGSHDAFYRVQQDIANKGGVVWKQNALRHTCISAKIALTKDVPKVAWESGNSVAVIKRHYLDLMTPSLAQAWFNITPSVVLEYRRAQAKAANAVPVIADGPDERIP